MRLLRSHVGRMRRPAPGTAGVLLFSLLLLLASAALWRLADTSSWHVHDRYVPWWVLAPIFGVAEVWVVHVQIRREARTLSLSDIPLLVGLFFTPPAQLLLARLLLPMAVLIFHRRQRPLKLTFNLALLTVDTCTAMAVFHAVAGGSRNLAVEYLGGYLAVWLAASVGAVAVTCVIAMHERVVRGRAFLSACGSGALMGTVESTFALVAINALRWDSASGWMLVGCGAILWLAFRAYASLTDRHKGLERIYEFTQAIGQSPATEQVLRSVLTEAKELLRTEQAELLFVPRASADLSLRVTLDRTGELSRRMDEAAPVHDVLSEVVRSGQPALLPQNVRDLRYRSFLADSGLREAIIVPLRGDDGVVGTLTVADRLGQVRTFDRDDVRLLQTLGNHAGMALEKSQLIERLRHESLHDPLTGLPNRTLFQQRLRRELESAALTAPAIMIMDLDGFKEVNDTLGHPAGDALLQQVASRVSTAAGRAATVARLGGDEFAVLLPDTSDVVAAMDVARRILVGLQEAFVVDDMPIGIAASIGVAVAPLHGDSSELLMRRADIAMYNAKAGLTGLCVYSSELDTHSVQRLAMVGDLRAAITLGELTIHVQPKAEASTGRVLGAEALVRWPRPDGSFIPPAEFVPVAERSGLIRALTSTVLHHSIAACAEWRRQGTELGIAVNLSARSLLDAGLDGEIDDLLRRYGLPAHLLTLEITESVLLPEPVRTRNLLGRFRAMGVRLSLDDFGTGYSSLSYLQQLPVSEVKIDRSFVEHMADSPGKAVIVRSVIDLAAHLSLDVVAEGVEDQDTWNRLERLGCRVIQGHHLSRPMPVEDFLPWVRARHEALDIDRNVTPIRVVAG